MDIVCLSRSIYAPAHLYMWKMQLYSKPRASYYTTRKHGPVHRSYVKKFTSRFYVARPASEVFFLLSVAGGGGSVVREYLPIY